MGDGRTLSIGLEEVDPSIHLRTTPVPLTRSPLPTTCPYLFSRGPLGDLLLPIELPHSANRCTAFAEPLPLSIRQQELVCLTASHADCPRYGREEDSSRGTRRSARRAVSRAILAAVLVVLAAASASLAFALARGGLSLPGPAPTDRGAVAAATGTPVPTEAIATPAPTAAATASPPATPVPSPSPAAPSPTVAPSSVPASDRYDLLEPCPNKPDCWIYTVRSGDYLSAIGNYFGHSLSTIYRLNPWTRNTGLRAGQKIVLPPPTR